MLKIHLINQNIAVSVSEIGNNRRHQLNHDHFNSSMIFIFYATHVNEQVWGITARESFPPLAKPSMTIIIDLNSKWTLPLCS